MTPGTISLFADAAHKMRLGPWVRILPLQPHQQRRGPGQSTG